MQLIKRVRSSKGSIAVYVSIVIISMLLILLALFFTSNAVRRNQLTTAMKVKETYEADNGRAAEIYESLVDSITPPGGSITDDGVPIPDGFYYVGGTKNDGVVISDNPADENQGAEHDKIAGLQGNQFVWVPVENPSDYFIEETVKLNGVETTTNVYSKLTIRDGDSFTSVKPGDTNSVREPDVLSSYDTDAQYYQDILGYGSTKLMADSFVEEYTEMYESIKKYKGFYIGRYELTGTVDEPTVKAGEVLSASSSQAKNWYGLRKACTEIIKDNANVTSTMIYGVEWDATMNWLKRTKFAEEPEKVDEDSSSWGNYSNSSGAAAIEGAGEKQNTGYSEAWSANHIYDLAGNCYDYTQEAYDASGRVYRGRLLRLFKCDLSSIRPYQRQS